MTASTFDATDSAAVESESGLPSRPEEKTWKYYSRHHEMPASGVSSLAVHLAVVGVLMVGGLLTAKVASNGRPPEIVPALAPDARDTDAGDGGSSGMAKNKETAEDVRPGARESAVVVPAIGTLSPVKRTALIPDQTGAERTLADSSQKAVRDFARQVETLPPASHSEPRHHVDDGVGGDGPNQGGDLTTKDKRRSRWQLDFQVTGPIDHLRQFAALGAILAVPEPQGGYRVFKDLHSWPGLKAPMLTEGRYPPGEHVDTLADIHWICFTDREPKTVAEVASVLGAPAAPYLLAFFPNELQEKMARLERQFHHRREEDIHSKTYFKVVPRGSGYAVVIDRSQAASP